MNARQYWSIGVAPLLLACNAPADGERVGEATGALVSPSVAVASVGGSPGVAVAWNCGVGLVAWIEPPGVRGVRFDANGVVLDASPFVIAPLLGTGFGASRVRVERAVDGFQVLVEIVGGPGILIQRGGTAYAVAIDGAVGAAEQLGLLTDSLGMAAWHFAGTGFDGTATYVVISSGTDPGGAQPTATLGVQLVKLGYGGITGDVGTNAIPPNIPSKSASLRGFGCGPAGCLLMTSAPSASGYNYIDRLIVDESVTSFVANPSTATPSTGDGDVLPSECGFLVVKPSASRLLDPTPAINAGPFTLPGSASLATPYVALPQGQNGRVYWGEGGMQSLAVDAVGQPALPVMEDASFAQLTLDVGLVDSSRAVQAYYDSGQIRIRFLGEGALVPTPGDCNMAPAPVASGAVCPPSFGDACSNGSECVTGFCVDGVCCDSVCDDGCNACSTAAGALVDGTCGPVTGPACDDGEPCSQSSSCVAGVCVGDDPLADGTMCEDENPCAETSVCQSGSCVLGAPVADGTSCPNTDPCSSASACQGGACVGLTVCTTPFECQIPVCLAQWGVCSFQVKPVGTPCDLDNLCATSFCNEGWSCVPIPVDCGPIQPCHEPSTCDPTTGACSAVAVADGTFCLGGTCVGGVCDTGTNQGGAPTAGGAPEGGASEGGSVVGGRAAIGGGPAGGEPAGGESPGGAPSAGNGGHGAEDQGGVTGGQVIREGCDCRMAPQRRSASALALFLAAVVFARPSARSRSVGRSKRQPIDQG